MESDADSCKKRNDALSQSYSVGIERVTQQNNDGIINFELPKEVLEKREKEWGNFFNKFREEVPNDIELNINTMEPIHVDERDEDDEDDDDDDDDEDQYYAKCKAPMRKLPALIQHWIDTGNPPYQLHDDDGHSETGSSLSEGEHSRSGQSAIIKESSDKCQPAENSPYSSVDTAAYILSNTNVTKKADTLVIVDGAKNGDKSLARKPSPLIGNIAEHEATKTGNQKCADHNTLDPENICSPSSHACPDANKSVVSNTGDSTVLLRVPTVVYQPEKHLTRTSKTESEATINPDLSQSKISQSNSIKLSEVLPALQQFDEFLEKSQVVNTPKTRLSVGKHHQRKHLVVPPTATGLEAVETSQSLLQASSTLPNGSHKLHNRRQLYTGRNSPVDLMEIRTSTDSAIPSGLNWHPALEPMTITDKTKIFVNRARARRKRKRATQNLLASSQDGNTSQDSSIPIVPNSSSKGNMRYTDFFESLGLTPSKTIIGKARTKPPTKRFKKSEQSTDTNNVKRKNKLPGASNKAAKCPNTSQTTQSSMIAPISQSSAKTDAVEKTAAKYVQDKILKVQILRLTEEDLARYDIRDVSSRDGKRRKSKTLAKSETRAGLSSDAFNKKKRNSNQANVELLTMNTHDSDSSTILLCKCTNDIHNQFSESDASLCVKENLQAKKKKQPHKEESLATKNYESEQESTQIHQSQFNVSNVDHSSKLGKKSQGLPVMDEDKSSQKRIESTDNAKTVKSLRSPELLVRLERLESEKIENLIKSKSRLPPSLKKNIALETAPIETSDLTLPVDSEMSNTKVLDPKDKSTQDIDKSKKPIYVFRTNSNDLLYDTDKCVSIESQDSAEINKSKLSVKQRKSPRQLKPRFKHIKLSSSSDDEDIFAKLIEETESRKQTSKVKNNSCSGVKSTSNKLKNDINDVINDHERSTPDNRLDESNRRKLTSSNKSDSSSEDKAKTADRKKRRTQSLRRSSRTKVCDNNESKNLSSSMKWKCSRNLFSTSQQSGLSDDEISSADKTREYGTSTEESHKEYVSPTVNLSNEYKNRMKSFSKIAKSSPVRNRRSTLRGARAVASAIRFQTRIDSDSDTEFETSKFMFSKKVKVPKRKTLSDGQKSVASSIKKHPTVKTSSMSEKSRAIRYSLQRSLKNSIKKQQKKADKIEVTKSMNISIEGSMNTSNGYTRTSRRSATSSPIKRLSLRHKISSPAKLQKPTSLKVKRTSKLSPDSFGKYGLRRSSSRSERLTSNRSRSPKGSPRIKKSLPRRNEKKKNSEYLMSTNKKRKTDIFQNSSDDGSDADIIRNSLSNSNTTKKCENSSLKNSTSLQSPNKMSIKDASEKNSQKNLRNRTKSLFSNNPNDTTEDDELVFGRDFKIPALTTVMVENLNFSNKMKKIENNNNRQSVMRFRTRLRYDSDDDNVL